MESREAPLTLEEVKHRRALRIEFTAGFFIGIAEGIFFSCLYFML